MVVVVPVAMLLSLLWSAWLLLLMRLLVMLQMLILVGGFDIFVAFLVYLRFRLCSSTQTSPRPCVEPKMDDYPGALKWPT